jgi:hypothetical protein
MRQKNTFILLLLVVIKVCFNYWLVDGSYNLHRDEYLHIDQGRHLAWGFDSVPPLTSWVSWIILKLGAGVGWIRFFPGLFGALTMVLVWRLTEKLGGNLFCCVLAAVTLLLSALLRLNVLYQPNTFDVLAWTAVYYTLTCYLQSGSNRWLYYMAIVFALGLLNKYNIGFLAIGLLPALLLGGQTKLLANKHLYGAALLCLILLLPNIIWQINNGLPVVHHMQELSNTQLVNVQRGDFLKDQLLFFIGGIVVIVAALFSFIVYAPYKPYRVIGWSFLSTLLLFVYLKAKSYYAMGLYPVLLPFGAVYLQYLLTRGTRQYLRPVLLALPVLLSIPMFRIAFPTAPPQVLQQKNALYQQFGLLRWEDGKDHHLPQDFADMLGWQELAAKVDAAYEKIPDKAHALVYCDNYGMAGAINYYSRYKTIAAVSMNADYVNWFPPASKDIKHLVMVKDIYDKDAGRKKEQPLFGQVILTDSLTNPYAREKGTRIYLLLNATVPIMPYFTEEINEVKKERSFFR